METAEKVRSGRAHRKRAELVSVVVITLAGAMTTWCSFQAALWDGEQSNHYNRSQAVRVESSRKSALANEQMAVDVSLFGFWLSAAAAEKPRLQQFYRDHFRPEFRAAFEQWYAKDPLRSTGNVSTPFAMPDYQLEATKDAQRLDARAERLTAEGDAANGNSDRYVLMTVMLALVLVLGGLAQQFRQPNVRAAMLVMAVGLLILATAGTAILPRASIG